MARHPLQYTLAAESKPSYLCILVPMPHGYVNAVCARCVCVLSCMCELHVRWPPRTLGKELGEDYDITCPQIFCGAPVTQPWCPGVDGTYAIVCAR